MPLQPTPNLSKSVVRNPGGTAVPPGIFRGTLSKNGMTMKIFLEKVTHICSSGRKFFGAPTHPSVVFSGRKIANFGFLVEKDNILTLETAEPV